MYLGVTVMAQANALVEFILYFLGRYPTGTARTKRKGLLRRISMMRGQRVWLLFGTQKTAVGAELGNQRVGDLLILSIGSRYAF